MSQESSSAIPGSGRVVAIDWGEKRIGLAVSDPSQTLAQPLKGIGRRSGRRFPVSRLAERIEGLHAVGLVVGLPLTPEGEEGESAAAAREVGELLKRVFGLPVEYYDERMTTARALRSIREMGGSTHGRKSDVDGLAATVLLQQFLEARR